MYIDTHAHLNYPDKYGDMDDLLSRIAAAGVDTVVNVGWDLPSSALAAQMAERYAPAPAADAGEGPAPRPRLFFAAGFHPSDCLKMQDKDLRELAGLLAAPGGVAVGEIGLDYHYEGTDAPAQKRAFAAQLELAHALSLPVIIHSRDAAADTLQLLKDNRAKLACGGVMHCFSGSPETAKEYLKLGLYISFAGPVTFKNARRLDEAAKIVPRDRILAETDSPYLAPEPHRGTMNTPANVGLIYQKLAQLRGEDVQQLAAQIKTNARTLFARIGKPARTGA